MAARLTPGGALLRTSRLFSLPPPLPPPATNDLAPASRASATATTPYPTHQAIATTPRSRARGDWGLKRPLPSLQTGTPLIRVRQLDAVEQVTDFASASDHVMTLEKVHEMGLAVGRPGSGGANAAMIGLRSDNRSVFEDEVDFTTNRDGSGAAGEAAASAAVARRWKFKGPWLAGMTDAELTRYLAREVRGRRAEFRSFLKTKLVADLNRAAIQAAMDSGEAPPSTALAAKDVTDEQVSEYLARLRGDRATLHDHVAEFLDLAPLPPTSILGFTSSTGTGAGTGSAKTTNTNAPKPPHQQSPYARDGPPATHPSAGLTYLRTSAVAENHPLYGPQRSRPPVVARILQPRYTRPGAGGGGSGLAQLGVAGLVADAPFGDIGGSSAGSHNPVFRRRGAAGQLQGAQARRHEALPGMTMLDLDTPGGAKAVVEPTGLTVASSGRVMLRTVAAASDAQLVKAEWLGLHDLYDAEGGEEPVQAAAPLPTRPARPTRPRGDTYGSSKTYGLE